MSPVRLIIDHPAQNHVAVSRRYLRAVSHSAQHVRGGHRCPGSYEWVESDVARIAERQQEELNERAGKRSRVRSLAALRLEKFRPDRQRRLSPLKPAKYIH